MCIFGNSIPSRNFVVACLKVCVVGKILRVGTFHHVAGSTQNTKEEIIIIWHILVIGYRIDYVSTSAFCLCFHNFLCTSTHCLNTSHDFTIIKSCNILPRCISCTILYPHCFNNSLAEKSSLFCSMIITGVNFLIVCSAPWIHLYSCPSTSNLIKSTDSKLYESIVLVGTFKSPRPFILPTLCEVVYSNPLWSLMPTC